jgi:hypothetical protein
LQRVVNLNIQDKSPAEALAELSAQAACVFSYNPALFGGRQVLSGQFSRKTVYDVLVSLFGQSFEYRERGNYIIINTKASEASRKEKSAEPLLVRGKVSDARTGKPLAGASIYSERPLASTISNQQGAFVLKIDKARESHRISVSRLGYSDTSKTVVYGQNSPLFIGLNPVSIAPLVTLANPASDLLSFRDTLAALASLNINPHFSASLSTEQGLNQVNIRNTLYREYQFSFVPYAGSNGKLSGNIINTYSFNILGGINLGVRRLELGGFFNMNRAQAPHIQIAGLFNMSGQKVGGTQIAGLFNYIKGRSAQANRPATTLTEPRPSASDTVGGVQMAGLLNFNNKPVKAVQIAGLLNFNTRQSANIQISGLLNINTRTTEGLRLAGLGNIETKNITGVQISSLFNKASKIRGLQIGLFNWADTVHGTQIGLVSMAAKGYHQVEFFTDEVVLSNVALRLGGNRAFYSIFTAGVQPIPAQPLRWTVGYGLGTSPRISSRWSFSAEVTSSQVSEGGFTQALNLYNRLYAGIEFRLSPLFALSAGPVFNVRVAEPDFGEYPMQFAYPASPHLFIGEFTEPDEAFVQIWIGYKIGLRFF